MPPLARLSYAARVFEKPANTTMQPPSGAHRFCVIGDGARAACVPARVRGEEELALFVWIATRTVPVFGGGGRPGAVCVRRGWLIRASWEAAPHGARRGVGLVAVVCGAREQVDEGGVGIVGHRIEMHGLAWPRVRRRIGHLCAQRLVRSRGGVPTERAARRVCAVAAHERGGRRQVLRCRR